MTSAARNSNPSENQQTQQTLARWARTSADVRAKTACRLDLAYGNAEGERLDFFSAASDKGRKGPLLVFIHGNDAPGKSHFSFVAQPFVKAGINVAIAGGTPAAQGRKAVLQQLRALAWLYRSAGKLGFDRERIVVAGHAEGAHLGAMMLTALWPQFGADLPARLVKAGILLSGAYQLDTLPAADAAALSPAQMPQATATPFLTAVGALESTEAARQCSLLERAWRASHLGNITLPQAGRHAVCDEFATPGRPLFEISARLIAGIR